MKAQSFAKLLSANDVGATGSHQAGILVPKSDTALLAFFPHLDPTIYNPDAWIVAEDDAGNEWRLRYIYYNSRLHGSGTRNEYRITYLTKYLKDARAQTGDLLRFTATAEGGKYRMALDRAAPASASVVESPGIIRLSGWRRVH